MKTFLDQQDVPEDVAKVADHFQWTVYAIERRDGYDVVAFDTRQIDSDPMEHMLFEINAHAVRQMGKNLRNGYGGLRRTESIFDMF